MSTQLTLFFVAFNGLAAVALGMGVGAELGLNLETGSPQGIEQLGATPQEDETVVGLGNNAGSGTLFGMYNQLTSQVVGIWLTITPGFQMLKIFLPDLWIDLLLSPLAVVIVIKDAAAFARGTDL